MNKCVFCGNTTSLDYCPTCNEYKGLEPVEQERKPIMLGSALANVFDLIEQARQAHIELGGCDDPDCSCDEEVACDYCGNTGMTEVQMAVDVFKEVPCRECNRNEE